MKKLVISALAASMASATALASESEWADLDRDVQALSASLAGLESSGVKLGGYIRAAYITSSDVTTTSGNDLGDFDVLNARLKATGSRGDIGYVLQAGFEDGGSASILKDAYVNIPVGANLTVRAGQFKGIISRDSLVSSSRLLFAERSEIGSLFSSRREGVALMGTFDTFDVVGDDTAGKGNVEIDTDEGFLALPIHIANGLLFHFVALFAERSFLVVQLFLPLAGNAGRPNAERVATPKEWRHAPKKY